MMLTAQRKVVERDLDVQDERCGAFGVRPPRLAA
jgi:hypothetical protein